MPIPQPSAGQSEQEYVSECIPAIIDEYGQEQAAAICYNTYRTKMSKMSSMERVILTINNNKNDALIPKGKV
jgi:hypothetical protein